MHSSVIPFLRDAVHWSSSFVGDLIVASSPAVETEISRCRDVKWKLLNTNQVAHCLEKFDLTFIDDFVWLEDCPLCVKPLILDDCS
ncbi:hypothetical protein ACOSQ2_011093 [Xanthoceras sorbifolium]